MEEVTPRRNVKDEVVRICGEDKIFCVNAYYIKIMQEREDNSMEEYTRKTMIKVWKSKLLAKVKISCWRLFQ